MKRSDLKDGMVLTTRTGRKFQKLTGSYLYSFKHNNLSELTLHSYLMDLTHECFKCDDIMKVEYMGEVLWERKEYYTLKEADKMMRDGKCAKLKHKDSTIWYTTPQYALLNAIGNTLLDMWELLEVKEFEVM